MHDATRDLRRTYAVVTELEAALAAIDRAAPLPDPETRRIVAAILHQHLVAAFDAGAAGTDDLRTALATRDTQLERLKKSRDTLQAQLSDALRRLRGGT